MHHLYGMSELHARANLKDYLGGRNVITGGKVKIAYRLAKLRSMTWQVAFGSAGQKLRLR